MTKYKEEITPKSFFVCCPKCSSSNQGGMRFVMIGRVEIHIPYEENPEVEIKIECLNCGHDEVIY